MKVDVRMSQPHPPLPAHQQQKTAPMASGGAPSHPHQPPHHHHQQQQQHQQYPHQQPPHHATHQSYPQQTHVQSQQPQYPQSQSLQQQQQQQQTPQPQPHAVTTNGRTVVHYTHDSLRQGPSPPLPPSQPSTYVNMNVNKTPSHNHPSSNINVTPSVVSPAAPSPLAHSTPIKPSTSTTHETSSQHTRKAPPTSIRATTTPASRRGSQPPTPMIPDTPVSPLQEFERDFGVTPTRPTPVRGSTSGTTATGRSGAAAGRGASASNTPARGGAATSSRGNAPPTRNPSGTAAHARGPSMTGGAAPSSRGPSMTAGNSSAGAGHARGPSMTAGGTSGRTPSTTGGAHARGSSMTGGGTATNTRAPPQRGAAAGGNRTASTGAGRQPPTPTASSKPTPPPKPAPAGVNRTPSGAGAGRNAGPPVRNTSNPPSRTPSAPNSRPPSATPARPPSNNANSRPPPSGAPAGRRKVTTPITATASSNLLNTPPKSTSRVTSATASPTPTAHSKATSSAMSKATQSTARTTSTAATSVAPPTKAAPTAAAPTAAAKTAPQPPPKKTVSIAPTAAPAVTHVRRASITVHPNAPPPITTSKSTPALGALIKSPITSTVSDLQRRYEDQGTLDLISGNYADAEALLAKALAYASSSDVGANKWTISLKLSRALAEQREFAEAKAVLVAAEKELLGLSHEHVGLHGDEGDEVEGGRTREEADMLFDARCEVRLALAGVCEMEGTIEEAEEKYWSVAVDTRRRYGAEHRLFLKSMLKEVELLACRREKKEEGEQEKETVVVLAVQPATPQVGEMPGAGSGATGLGISTGNNNKNNNNNGIVARVTDAPGGGVVARVNDTPSPRRRPERSSTLQTAPVVQSKVSGRDANGRMMLRDRSTSVSGAPPSMGVASERPVARRAITAEANNRLVSSPMLNSAPIARNHSSPRLSALQTTQAAPRASRLSQAQEPPPASPSFIAARRTFSRSPGRRPSLSQGGGAGNNPSGGNSGRNSRMISRSPSPYQHQQQHPMNNSPESREKTRRFIQPRPDRGGVKTASNTPTAPTFAASVSGGPPPSRPSALNMIRTRTNPIPDTGTVRGSVRDIGVRDVRDAVVRDVTVGAAAAADRTASTLEAAAMLVERERRRRSRSVSPGRMAAATAAATAANVLPTSTGAPRRRLSFTSRRPRSASQERGGGAEEAINRFRSRSREPAPSVASDPLRAEPARMLGRNKDEILRGLDGNRDSQSDGGLVGKSEENRATPTPGGVSGTARVGLTTEQYGRVMDFLKHERRPSLM